MEIDKPKQTLQSRANIRTIEEEHMLPGNGAQTGSKLSVVWYVRKKKGFRK